MNPSLIDRFLRWWLQRGFRGFLTLDRVRRACGGSRRILARTSYGSMFSLDPFAHIDAIVLREGYYESEVLEALLPFLDNASVLWDVGGNLGLHSVTIKVLRPAVIVCAFEPNPEMIREIGQNAALNRVAVEVVPCALAETGGPRTFHVADRGNAGMSTLHAWSGAQYTRQISVEAARGDELVKAGRVPAPTVIKLDVEGAGTRPALTSSSPRAASTLICLVY